MKDQKEDNNVETSDKASVETESSTTAKEASSKTEKEIEAGIENEGEVDNEMSEDEVEESEKLAIERSDDSYIDNISGEQLKSNWINLIKPNKINAIAKDESNAQAKFVAGPLERGFGQTIGNSLRRVLLSSLQGAAVTSIEIQNVLHEFSTIPGVKEDVSDIILNIKSLALRLYSDSDRVKKMELKAKGPGVITASMIETPSEIEIHSPDVVICTLDKGADIMITFNVEHGKGYLSSAQNRSKSESIGVIPIDSIFTPVKRVSYKVDNMRVGRETDYDQLTLDIETNGTISAEECLELSARILQEQLASFVHFEDPIEQVKEKVDVLPFNYNLLKRVEDLELSVRSANCLKNDNVVYIGDLVQKSEQDMLRTPNFGRKSLNEIKEVLSNLGLQLDMPNQGWPPENIEELISKAGDSF